MNSRNQEHLLREVFADAELDALRESSLARGLAATRARGRRRRMMQACAVGAAPALVLGVALLLRPASPTPPLAAGTHIVASAEAPTHEIKNISDAELLALFPDRSVGLIGSPGHQQLVFFDEPALPQG